MTSAFRCGTHLETMRRLQVLLTNDDGPDSPLLAAFAETLAAESWCAGLRIVVPAREKSWIGKAITRFSPLNLSERRIGDHLGHVVALPDGSGGTPADCVELGLGNLYPGDVDLVVSGINMGLNVGVAFALSSGTLGAALEATLNGVPGIAVSAEIPPDVLRAWRERGPEDETDADRWTRLAASGSEVCRRILAAGAASRAEVLSVNLPWSASPASPIRMTRLMQTRFRNMFRATEADRPSFVHASPGFIEDEAREAAVAGAERELPADLEVVRRGEIALTALGPLLPARSDRALADALERPELPNG